MEWVKLAIDLAGALAWPVVALVALLSFRGPVVKLLNPRTVTRFKVGTDGLELERDVSRRLSMVRELVAESSVPTVVPTRRASEEPAVVHAVRAAAERDPNAAVLAAAAWYQRSPRDQRPRGANNELAEQLGRVAELVRAHPEAVHLTRDDALTYAWGVHALLSSDHSPTLPQGEAPGTTRAGRLGTGSQPRVS